MCAYVCVRSIHERQREGDGRVFSRKLNTFEPKGEYIAGNILRIGENGMCNQSNS